MINYFNFKRLENDKYLLTNDFGNYQVVDDKTLHHLLNNQVDKIENKDEF